MGATCSTRPSCGGSASRTKASAAPLRCSERCPRRKSASPSCSSNDVEAIILAGGKAERLGEAARGRPKALVDIGGRPLIAYQLASPATAGVHRVIISCAAGAGELFGGLSGAEFESVEEPEPLSRRGGLHYAAARRREAGPPSA